ncbi:MAG TPA: hypothetical protein VFL81_01855, partial [Candidatus Saccharimonadales bacterium]|nr:hypothetical protein [Candidatus Saccharimonadales bacterium]
MPKTKTKKKALLKIIAITAATTFIVTLLLVWLANFNYLYQKHQADIAGDKSLMSSLELNLNKLASKSGA